MPNPRGGKPPHVIRPIKLKTSLPEDLKATVDLLLYSELEGKVPYAAWSNYLVGLIRADLRARGLLPNG